MLQAPSGAQPRLPGSSYWPETHCCDMPDGGTADPQLREAVQPGDMRHARLAAFNSAGNPTPHSGLIAHARLSEAESTTHHETAGRARLPGAAGHAGRRASQPILARGRAVTARQLGGDPGDWGGVSRAERAGVEAD